MMSRRLGLSPDLRLGGGASATAPVMEVTGNGVAIANGDATPSAGDHTDFGSTPYSITVSRTFTINNTGDADLTGVNVLVPTGYTLVTSPDATITALGSDTFVVRCDAGSVAALAGNITIESTELSDYVFAITCNSQHPYDAYATTAALAFDAVKSTKFQDSGRTTPAGQGDVVGSWSDGSGNNRHVSQSTTAAKPTLTTTDSVVSLSFDGGDFLQVTGFTLNQPSLVLIVGKMTNIAAQRNLIDSANNAARHVIYQSTSTFRSFAGTALSDGASNTNWHVFDTEFNGASSNLRIDGSETSGNAGSQAMTGATIGANNGGASEFLIGNIAAVWIFDTVPSAAALAAIRAYYANEVLP